MKVYTCSIQECGAIINKKIDVYHINLSSIDEKIEGYICKDCYNKILELIRKENEIDNSEKESVEQQPKHTVAEHIESIGGIDVLMKAVCTKEKTIEDFENQFGVKKNVLRAYLSSHGFSIRKYAQDHGLILSKSKETNANNKIHVKINEIGLDNILEDLSTRKTTMKKLAEEIGVTKSQLATYFYKNFISVKDYRKKQKEIGDNKKVASKIKNNSENINKIIDKAKNHMGLKTVATYEMKHLERQIEVVSGSCFKCGYRDLNNNTCGYAIITGKSRRGGKGKCYHFVDVDKL